jgi:hypothetical protein
VTVEFAFTRIEAAVGALEVAEEVINEGLRSGRLKSGELQSSPDSEATWRTLDTSDWEQRRVRAMRPIIFRGIFPGITASPPQRGERSVYIVGPKFAGQVFICRADLDELTAAPPTMTAAPQSDDTRPPERRRGPIPKHEWHAIAGEIARRCINPKTRHLEIPKSERKLAQAVLGWCQEKYGKEPAESDMRAAVKTVCAALRPLEK